MTIKYSILASGVAAVAFALIAPSPSNAQQFEAGCRFLGTTFSNASKIKISGTAMKCGINSGLYYWSSDADVQDDIKSVSMCILRSEFYSSGAVVDDQECDKNGNWTAASRKGADNG